jgi:hypothetical protein
VPSTGTPAAAFEAGQALLGQQRWATAAMAFRDLLKVDPGFPEAHRGYGDALLRMKCWEESLLEYGREIDRNPNSAGAHEGQARVLFQLERCQESEAAFARVAALRRGAPSSERIAPPSEALTSFKRFVGDRPFTASDYFHLMIEELEWEGITWISRLDEKKDAEIWPLDRLVPGLTCLTMGPLEGSLEWELIRLRASRIVAIEGTRANFLKCHVLKAAFPHLPIEFVKGDVVTTDVSPEFDAVFCQGVLYHLSEPHVLLAKVFALKPKLVFLDTQLGVGPEHPASTFRGLTNAVEIEFGGRAYRGRLFPEGPNPYLAGLDQEIPSIWLFPDDLRKLLQDVGFRIEDQYVIDLGQLGVSGCYICSVPGVASPVRVRVGLVRRTKRWWHIHVAPRLPMVKAGRSRLRG